MQPVDPESFPTDPVRAFMDTPERGDHMNVNGVELFRLSFGDVERSLCFLQSFTVWVKETCFDRLWESSKQLELQVVLAERQKLSNNVSLLLNKSRTS